MIRVGTSGFSYRDWKGYFYPPDARQRDFLSYYATRFDTCELNFSYYRIPDARTLARMVEKSEARVEFTMKAFQAMTHSRDASPEILSSFVEAMGPLRESGVFGALLLQFPFSFRRDRKADTYLASLAGRLRECWPEIPMVVEFRHRSWVSDESFQRLEALRLGNCAVDEPRIGNLMPPVAVATGPISYVRFHGRNAAKWWTHDRPEERYDYRYTDAEISEWIPRIRALESVSDKTYVFFNNHFQGKAADNACRLLDLLSGGDPASGGVRS